MKMRIFIGLSNTAGYGTRLVKGFRNIGVKADLYVRDEHVFKYDTAYSFKIKHFSNKWLSRLYVRYFLLKVLLKYDSFIFFSGQTLLKENKDLKILRFLKKKSMVLFLGCDIQQPELTFREDIPYSSCHNCTPEYKNFVGCIPEKKILMTRRIEVSADFLVTNIALADPLKKDFINAVQPINIEDFPIDIPKIYNKIPVILHAPSNFGYKGTPFLLKAIEQLKKEFTFEFKLVNNVTIQELYEEILKADIIVDQLIQGWYGMLPLEAMMLKRPVVCYIRDDVKKELPESCPVISANPSDIYDVLKNLLQNASSWESIGEQGRKYVEEYHDAKKITKSYYDLLT